MAGARMIRDRYRPEACLPRMLALFEHATAAPLLVS
jgi:hypothetical protein